MLPNDIKHLQVQPSRTESPLSMMTIGALEVSAARFDLWGDVPASTTFVGDDGELVVVGHMSHEV